MAEQKGFSGRRVRWLSPLVALATMAGGLLAMTGQAQADVTTTRGSAYGYRLHVNLFGGPFNTRGVGQVTCTNTNEPAGCVPPAQAAAAASPLVTLPSTGSAPPITATGASTSGFVGPAEFFSSGQIDVSTRGTTGASGSVTSSTNIANVDRNGSESFGYGPLDLTTLYPKNPTGLVTSVSSTCTASETGLSGSTTITNGQLELDNGDDPVGNGTYSGAPTAHPPVRVTVPTNPAPNTTYNGHIEVNGSQDYWTYVFNEQVTNPDGSLTVYAGHEYILGPTAVGDLYFGKSQCGVKPDAAPVAGDDLYGADQDTPLTVPAPGVLGNDTDADADTVTAGSASNPPGGSVILNTDGSFTYTPDPGFAGIDTFTYVASDGYGGSDLATVTIKVTAHPPSLSIADVSVPEGDGPTTATFTVTRSGLVPRPSTVRYRTSDGTAKAGTDYTAVAPTTLSFAAGETSKTVGVPIIGDSLPEASETFSVLLSSPTGAVVSDASAVGTLLNDDGSAYLSVNDVAVTEGNAGTTPATFTITRSGNTAGASSVKYATSDGTAKAGTDYTAVALTTLDFAPGETTKTVTVDVTGDTVDEANETFKLTLSAPSVGTTLSDSAGTAIIVDDDGPITPGPSTFLSVNDLSVNEGNAGTTPATFTITRSGNTAGASSVKYATTNGTATAGTDYTAVPSTTVSFAAGETTKTVPVSVTGDTLAENNETFNLILSLPTGAAISDGSGIATIVNDDGSAYLSINDVSVREGNTGTTPASFTITRSGNTNGASTVTYSTNTGTAGVDDFTPVAATSVTFGAGETVKTVAVAVTGDTVHEVDENFTVVLSAPVGATISDTVGIATIVDDD